MAMHLIRVIARWMIRVANYPVKRSEWYRKLFDVSLDSETLEKLAWGNGYSRNFDVMVLGSSAAYWGIDDSNASVRCLKLAHCRQKMINDYRILKCAHSLLKRNGIVIFVVCPLSSISSAETVIGTLRYLKFFKSPELVMDKELCAQAKKIADNPLLLGRPAMRAGLKVVFHLGRNRVDGLDERPYLEYNTLNEEALTQDAIGWMDGWAREFHIANFDYRLTEENEFGRDYKVFLMRKMIFFCNERGYKPIIVVPPVSRYLLEHFSKRFCSNYIDSFLSNFKETQVLNYLNEEQLQDPSLYFNSFFLNRRGRTVFTKRLLEDVL